MQQHMVKSKKKVQNIDEVVTGYIGSMHSIYIHSFLFILFLTLPLFTELSYDYTLLVLTTIVSLEAIYLALFIQISVNRQSKDIEEIQEDVEDISEDIEEISEDVEELSEDVEEVSKDVEEISEDVEGIQEDLEEAEKEEELEEKEEEIEEEREKQRKEDQKVRLEKIENALETLLKEISNFKK
jgi:uncharacterized membrane protein